MNKNYEVIPYKSHKEWLELRRIGIGGSDVGSILHLHNYGSPTSCYFSKLESRDDIGNESTRAGHLWEGIIRQTFVDDHGMVIFTPAEIFKSKEHPFMIASLDGYGIDKDGIEFVFEAKYTNSFELIKSLATGNIPLHWEAQVQHYMAVTGFSYAIIAYQAGSDHHAEFRIERDDDLIQDLIVEEERFWGYIENKTPPPEDYSKDAQDALREKFSEVIDDTADLSFLEDVCQKLARNKEKRKTLKIEEDTYKTRLKQAMGNFKRAVAGNYKLTWSRYVSQSFDTKKFKKENPDLVEAYTVEKPGEKFNVTEIVKETEE